MKRVIILSRVSTDGQELMSQTDKIKEFVLKNYSEDEIIIIENKESGVKKAEEELLGINEMKLYIETNNIECVYCYELSRLSRRPKVLYSLRDYFIEHKTQLIVLNPYFRLLNDDFSLNDSSSVIFALYSSFAEQEARSLKERCLRGRYKKKEQGKFIGGKDLFGYCHDKDGNYFINEEDANVVREIFQLYIIGESKLGIARKMRSRGYFLNFQNAVDCHTMIDNVLHNRDYCGQNGKPRIIDDNTFNLVQQLFPAKKSRTITKRLALGRSLLFNPYSTNRRQLYFVNTRINSYFSYIDEQKEDRIFVNISIVDKLIWFVTKKHYNRLKTVMPLMVTSFFPELENIVINQKTTDINDKIASINDEIVSLKNSLQKIEERLIYGKLTDEKAEELEETIEKKISLKKLQLKELKENLEQIPEIKKSEVNNIDDLSDDEKCSLVRKIFTDIQLYQEKKFHWRIDFYLDNETIEKYKIYTKNKEYYILENDEWVSLDF